MAWYECKVTHLKWVEGDNKTAYVTEPFLVSALSVTEAAARITEELGGDIAIESVTRRRLQEVFLGDKNWDRPFFLAKANLTTTTESDFTEREQTFRYLIEADDLSAALERLKREFTGTVSDWELLSLAESPIVEVVTAPGKEEGLPKFNLDRQDGA